MSAALGLTIAMYAVGLAVVCVTAAARNRERSPLVVPALAVLEAAVILQVIADLFQIGRHRPVSLATHLGYIMASLLVLPAAAGSTGLDRGRWGSAALAIGAVVTAVVSVRVHQTLGPARG